MLLFLFMLKKSLLFHPLLLPPISVIPDFRPKRLVYNPLYEYLNDRNLLSKCHSGFRPLHFMLYAWLEATTEWFSNLDQGQINSVAFLDLPKAFDTVDHSVLPKKLALYGVRDTSCKWFKSSHK